MSVLLFGNNSSSYNVRNIMSREIIIFSLKNNNVLSLPELKLVQEPGLVCIETDDIT